MFGINSSFAAAVAPKPEEKSKEAIVAILTTAQAYEQMPVKSVVKDKLSGKEGIVASPPDTQDYGAVIFANVDGQVIGLEFNQLSLVSKFEAPKPAEKKTPPPIKGKLVPKARPKKTTLSADYKAASTENFSVSAAKDSRNIQFNHIKDFMTAAKSKTFKTLASFLGYVPGNWDKVVSRLRREGVKLTATAGQFDVRDMIKKGYRDNEIQVELAAKGVKLIDINAALRAAKGIKAGQPTSPKPIDPPSPGKNWAWSADDEAWIEVATANKKSIQELEQLRATLLPA